MVLTNIFVLASNELHHNKITPRNSEGCAIAYRIPEVTREIPKMTQILPKVYYRRCYAKYDSFYIFQFMILRESSNFSILRQTQSINPFAPLHVISVNDLINAQFQINASYLINA